MKRGFLSLWMALILAGLSAALAGICSTAAHTAGRSEKTGAELAAQYAAESGAVWGIACVRKNGFAAGDHFFSSEGADISVRLKPEEDGRHGEILSKGEAAGILCYVRLTVSVKEGEERQVTVEETGRRKW